jgi:hypothetical protein
MATVANTQNLFPSVIVFCIAVIGVTLFITTENCTLSQVRLKNDLQQAARALVAQNKYDDASLLAVLKDYKLSKATIFKMNREGKILVSTDHDMIGTNLLQDGSQGTAESFAKLKSRAMTGGGFTHNVQFVSEGQLRRHVAYTQALKGASTDFVVVMHVL